jgi:hypothetical protein
MADKDLLNIKKTCHLIASPLKKSLFGVRKKFFYTTHHGTRRAIEMYFRIGIDETLLFRFWIIQDQWCKLKTGGFLISLPNLK